MLTNLPDLKFEYKYFSEFNSLCYSGVKNITFCKYCVLFSKSVGVGNRPLGNFVTTLVCLSKRA